MRIITTPSKDYLYYYKEFGKPYKSEFLAVQARNNEILNK